MTRPRASLLDLITMSAVVIGLIYGALELRQFRQARERDAVLELFRTIQTPQYVQGINVILAIPESVTVAQLDSIRFGPDRDAILHLLMTWESLGIMVYRRDVPIEWVDEFYRFGILETWRKFRPQFEAYRKRVQYEGIGEWTQWLAERLIEHSDQATTPAFVRYRDWKP